MSVSFNIHFSNFNAMKSLSRPCFASINQATNQFRDDIFINHIEYLPFWQSAWDNEAQASLESHVMPENMTWDIAHEWWKFLLNVPYFSAMILDRPTTLKAMMHGFKVTSNAPSDRVMLTLFMFRAPQFQAGIVRSWHHLVTKFKCPKDVAFVTAFALNNTRYGNNVHTYSDESDVLQRFNPLTDEESTIIYPGYFSLKGAQLMLNRLLDEDYDTLMYAGEQELLRRSGRYERFPIRNRKALGRFFAKKQGCSHSTGNLQCIISNDILDNVFKKRHWQLHHMDLEAYKISDSQMNNIIELIGGSNAY